VIPRPQPVPRSFGITPRPRYDTLAPLQPVELQHAQEGSPHPFAQLRALAKFSNRSAVQERSAGIHRTRLGQREQPLDVVVNRFQTIVRPTLNLREETPAVIGCISVVEIDNRGAHVS
jgi:hypothetical protein